MAEQVKNKLVSIVIPAYNCGWCITAAIDSVFSQTLTDYEIIIVDDGSQDDTKERLETITDRRLKYIYQENAGRAAARNTGIKAASGEWIAFLDADDLWLPTKLENQVKAAETNPEVVMVYGQCIPFSTRNLETGQLTGSGESHVIGSGKPGAGNYVNEFLLAAYPVITSTVIARRKTLLQIDGFDTQFPVGEDWDLYMRLAVQGPVLYVDDPVAYYWLGPYRTNLERGQRYNWHLDLLRVAEKNVKATRITETNPVFAAQVLATWEWRCALVEHGLGRAESAKQHTAKGLAYQETLFQNDAIMIEVANFLFDVLGREASVKVLEKRLQSIVDDLIPSSHPRKSFFRKCLAQFYAMKAFDAYAERAPLRGLRLASIAASLDARWLQNRGIWTLAVRKLLSA